jgi:hypothetical protein
LAPFKGPNRVDAFHPHLKKERDPVFETLFSNYLGFRTVKGVYKASDSERFTPSSEPFRFDLRLLALDSATLNGTDVASGAMFTQVSMQEIMKQDVVRGLVPNFVR